MLFVGHLALLAFLAKEHLQEMLFNGPLALLAYRPFGLLAKTSVRDVVCCAFSLVGLFGQRTSARDVVHLALGPIGLLAFLAKAHLQEMSLFGHWPYWFLASWSKNICMGCCLFGLWPNQPSGRLAFLVKEHLQGMLFIWPLALLAFRPFGLFGQRTSARDVVYLAFGPIGL